MTPVQEQVARAMTAHDIGVFVAPPGSGKTVVGAELIARRKRNTLVLVHRTQLLEQWIAQLALFLNLKPKEIGGGKRKPNGNPGYRHDPEPRPQGHRCHLWPRYRR